MISLNMFGASAVCHFNRSQCIHCKKQLYRIPCSDHRYNKLKLFLFLVVFIIIYWFCVKLSFEFKTDFSVSFECRLCTNKIHSGFYSLLCLTTIIHPKKKILIIPTTVFCHSLLIPTIRAMNNDSLFEIPKQC